MFGHNPLIINTKTANNTPNRPSFFSCKRIILPLSYDKKEVVFPKIVALPQIVFLLHQILPHRAIEVPRLVRQSMRKTRFKQMITIQIQRLQITGNRQSIGVEIPSGWNECNIEQAIIVYGLIMSDENPTPHEKRLAVMKYLTTLSWEELKIMQDDHQRENGEENGDIFYFDELEELCKAIADPFFEITTDEETGAKTYAIALDLTKNKYPYLVYQHPNKKVKPLRLWACADEFENMTIYELGTVFTLFENYLRQPNEPLLHQLFATIYRSPKPEISENKQAGYQGDIRRPLMGEEVMVERRAKHFEPVPEQVKHLMLLWIASCRQKIIREYPVIFDSETHADGKNFGWGGMLLQIAGGPVHLEAVAKQHYGNVFVWLSMLEDERKKQILQSAR